MIFREIEIKSDGGCYKYNITVFCFKNFSRLVKIQKGLSIYTLCIEKSIFEVNHIFIPLYWDFNLSPNRISVKIRDFPLRTMWNYEFWTCAERYTQTNQNPWESHHFSSCLQRMNDHHMKKIFLMKIIIFLSIKYEFINRNEVTIDFL